MVGEDIARAALDIGAIKLRPNEPFTWASGLRMPIYNDNRMFLWYPEHRRLIGNSFFALQESLKYDVVAGTATAGIPHAEKLADMVGKPMIYIRDKPKSHGMKNRIEGIDAESDLSGYRVLLIEDLISTGGSSASAVQAIRDANGECDHCFSIFDYGFDEASQVFLGNRDYNKTGGRLGYACGKLSLLGYDTLLRVAVDARKIRDDDVEMLGEWRQDHRGWGEAHGFPMEVDE